MPNIISFKCPPLAGAGGGKAALIFQAVLKLITIFFFHLRHFVTPPPAEDTK